MMFIIFPCVWHCTSAAAQLSCQVFCCSWREDGTDNRIACLTQKSTHVHLFYYIPQQCNFFNKTAASSWAVSEKQRRDWMRWLMAWKLILGPKKGHFTAFVFYLHGCKTVIVRFVMWAMCHCRTVQQYEQPLRGVPTCGVIGRSLQSLPGAWNQASWMGNTFVSSLLY